ncbi:hypothetical protein [Paenibacillus glycanilyticus]|uniref:hypothetical protein n=1 Tax=Paenibacillus glycanilyticus TaxID=126569 RepID=UPI003EBFB034
MMNIGKNFYYNSESSWLPAPGWLNFFFKTGQYFAQEIEEKRKLTMGITVPVGNFIPSIISLGLMAGFVNSANPTNLIDNHFNSLLKLPIGTILRFRNQGMFKIGKFIGTTEMFDETLLMIQTQNASAGGLTEFVSKKRSLDISINQNQDRRIPNSQSGKKELNYYSPFMDCFFEDVDYKNSYTFSDTKFLLLGERESLLNETVNAKFGFIAKKKRFISGSLNEILRIKSFMGANELFQSDVLTSKLNKKEQVQDLRTVIIYCNSLAYLNWGDFFRGNNSIVILNRTDTQYQLAKEELNNRYLEVMKFAETPKLEFSSDMPNGIETLCWKESKCEP